MAIDDTNIHLSKELTQQTQHGGKVAGVWLNMTFG